MSLLVVGSVAFDSIETPTEKRERVLGGSAVYCSYSASFFTKVHLVGVVGGDWPAEHTALLNSRGIDTSGLQVIPGKSTFFWRGKYLDDMNQRETLEVHLNVFGEFNPVLPPEFTESKYVFLANGAPEVQMKVLEQVKSPKLVVADTMDLWIREHTDGLHDLLKRIDGLVLNDSEAKLLTQETNLITAAKRVLEMGPRFVVIKKGEHGAVYQSATETFVLPAYPTEKVVDPTGAGDSFAGGMMGYLSEVGKLDDANLKKSLAYGTVVASHCVEGFSLDQLKLIDRASLDGRIGSLRDMLEF